MVFLQQQLEDRWGASNMGVRTGRCHSQAKGFLRGRGTHGHKHTHASFYNAERNDREL